MSEKHIGTSWTIYIPVYVQKLIKRLAKEMDFTPSFLISWVFSRVGEDRFVAIAPFKIEARTIPQGILQTIIFDIKERAKRVYIDDIIVCPLKKENARNFPQLFIKDLKGNDIIEFLVRLGIKFTALAMGLHPSYVVKKQMKIGDGITQELYAKVDIYDPLNKVIWFIVAGSNKLDDLFMLRAHLYKTFLNAEKIKILLILTKEERIIEQDLDEKKIEDGLNNLGIEKRGEELLKELFMTFIGRRKIPLWENECETCPARMFCSR